MKIDNICLVLTACMVPSPDVFALEIKDVNVRKQQYIDSLIFYIRNTNLKKIIFCDNSNFKELDEIKKLAEENNKEFEWICFQGNTNKTIEKGKGYGEGEILKYVCENSKLIQRCEYMLKITGRLKITNINHLIRLAKEKKNYVNIYIDKKNQFYADTRCFLIVVSEFKKYLINEYENVNDKLGETLELCIGNKIMNSEMSYNAFITYIGYEGVSGSTGLKYHLNVRDKIYLSFRQFGKFMFKRKAVYEPIENYQSGIVLDESEWSRKFSDFSNKRLAIYGAGILGKRLYKLCIKHCVIIIWADGNYKKIKRQYGKKIESPDSIKFKKVDYVVIAVTDLCVFKEIYEMLKIQQMQETRIAWYDGQEMRLINEKEKVNGWEK